MAKLGIAAPGWCRTCCSRRAIARLTMSEPSVGESSAPSPSQDTPGSASVSTVTSLHRSSARPKQSNPGPRFADVAGTRTVTIALQAELGGDDRGSAGTTTGCAAPEIAHSGSFSPWPVRMHTTVAPAGSVPAACELEQTGDAGRLAGSANRPSRATRR